MTRTNVALIGFMCSGKSTVGRGLATQVGKSFVETDALVEELAGMRIDDMFAQHGEERFRDLEAQVVAGVVSLKDCVISCGGGVVLRPENVAALRTSAVVVFLEAAPGTVLRRLGPRCRVRPLLDRPDRELRIKELMAERRPIYTAAADIIVQTDGLAVEQVVRRIEERLKQL